MNQLKVNQKTIEICLLFLAIILVSLLVTKPLWNNHTGFPVLLEEPDAYYYYSVLTQTVLHSTLLHLHITTQYANGFNLGASGFPEHPGLIAFPFYLYEFLHFIGIDISALYSEYLLEYIFAISSVLFTYWLVKLYTHDWKYALFAILLLSLSLAFYFKAIIIEIKGETFILPMMLLLNIVFYKMITLKHSKTNDGNYIWRTKEIFKLISYIFLLILISALSAVYWSGGVVVSATLIFLFITYSIYLWKDNKLYILFLIALLITVSLLSSGYLIDHYFSSIYTISIELSEVQPLFSQGLLYPIEFFGILFFTAIIYLIYMFAKIKINKFRNQERELLFITMASVYTITLIVVMIAIRFSNLLMPYLAIFSVLLLFELYNNKIINKKNMLIFAFAMLFISFIVFAKVVLTYPPADHLTPAYYNALMWIKNNTPSNAIIFTLFQDGSVVSALDNMSVVSTSVQGMGTLFLQTPKYYMSSPKSLYAENFTSYIINESKLAGKPLYILTRFYYVNLTVSFRRMSGIPYSINASDNNTILQSMLNKSFTKDYPCFKLVFNNSDSVIYKYSC